MHFDLHCGLTVVVGMLLELVLVLFSISVILVSYFRNAFKYWERKGVGFLEPKFPVGNSLTLLPTGIAIGVGSKIYYDELKKKGLKFGGIYLTTEPNLVLVDPDYIRDVLVKDFQHFVDRGFYSNERDDFISFHLFSADGSKWRQLRTKLTPTFTSGMMKMMFQTILDCCDSMISALKDSSLSGTDVEIRDFLSRFTIDVIGSVAFGIECNSFEAPDAEFKRMGEKIFESSFTMVLKSSMVQNMPGLSRKLRITVTDKDVSDFFTKTVSAVVEYRRKNQVRRNDFLQILIDLNEEDGQKLTFNEIVAQVFLFFIAGFDTSSTTINFALFELSRNQLVQDQLREEINIVLAKHDNKITYDSISDMEYLDQVIKEALRMYPPAPTLTRVCVKDYQLRDTDITIEKGTPVLISTLGLHMDPEYFPEPEKFDPGRFSNKMKATRHPYVHLPFGEGPRNCIALRFGYMQSKIGVIGVIRNYKLELSSKTKPVVLDPKPFLLKSVDPIYVKISPVCEIDQKNL